MAACGACHATRFKGPAIRVGLLEELVAKENIAEGAAHMHLTVIAVIVDVA